MLLASDAAVAPAVWIVPVSWRWQATKRPGATSRKAGSTSRQTGITLGQRVEKLHPFGGLAGEGTSPFRMILCLRFSMFGSGSGTADRSAWE